MHSTALTAREFSTANQNTTELYEIPYISAQKLDDYIQAIKNGEAPTQILVPNKSNLEDEHNERNSTLITRESKFLDDKKRLNLVLDLDLTLLHSFRMTTAPLPYTTIPHLYCFKLPDDTPYYLLKLRPNIFEFLHEAAKLYNLYVYTSGCYTYAIAIMSIIDPNHTLIPLSNVISRLPNEKNEPQQKILEKIFPPNINNKEGDDNNNSLNTNNEEVSKTIIIDDNPMIWNYSKHLYIVRPYYFFHTYSLKENTFEQLCIIEDALTDVHLLFLLDNLKLIHSRFFEPSEMITTTTTTTTTTTITSSSSSSSLSDQESSSLSSSSSSSLVETQICEVEVKTLPVNNNSNSTSTSISSSVNNNNTITQHEIIHIDGNNDKRGEDNEVDNDDGGDDDDSTATDITNEEIDSLINSAFTSINNDNDNNSNDYEDDDNKYKSGEEDDDNIFATNIDMLQSCTDSSTSSATTTTTTTTTSTQNEAEDGLKTPPWSGRLRIERSTIHVLQRFRNEILSGVHIYFSSIIPPIHRPSNTYIWKLAKVFGAECSEVLSPLTTHVVAVSLPLIPDPTIHYVHFQWLLDIFFLWKRIDESPYYLRVYRHRYVQDFFTHIDTQCFHIFRCYDE